MARHILIVEDDYSLRSLFERAFSMAGFTVSTAVDGNEAMTRLAGNPPDVMLLDLGIPGKDGLSVLKYMRRHERIMKHIHPDQDRRTNVIVVTGNHLASDSAEARLADMFLLKPVEIQELLTLVQRLNTTSERLVS